MTIHVFDSKSISSIGGRGKRNSPALLEYIASELDAYAEDIGAIITATGFTTKNLSSMLHGAGKELGAGIQALVTHKDKLQSIIAEGIFDAKNLSSMFASSSKDLGAGVQAIASRMQKLKALARIIPPSTIATRLHAIPAKKMAAAIDVMYNKLIPEISGITEIPPGSGVVIAEGSPATKRAKGKG